MFLAPDNYVQADESVAGYNRYAYCMNNPLKYTDPSGEFFLVDDAIWIGIAVSTIIGGVAQASAQFIQNPRSNLGDLLKAGALGAASGFITGFAGGLASTIIGGEGALLGMLKGGIGG